MVDGEKKVAIICKHVEVKALVSEIHGAAKTSRGQKFASSKEKETNYRKKNIPHIDETRLFCYVNMLKNSSWQS